MSTAAPRQPMAEMVADHPAPIFCRAADSPRSLALPAVRVGLPLDASMAQTDGLVALQARSRARGSAGAPSGRPRSCPIGQISGSDSGMHASSLSMVLAVAKGSQL